MPANISPPYGRQTHTFQHREGTQLPRQLGALSMNEGEMTFRSVSTECSSSYQVLVLLSWSALDQGELHSGMKFVGTIHNNKNLQMKKDISCKFSC